MKELVEAKKGVKRLERMLNSVHAFGRQQKTERCERVCRVAHSDPLKNSEN